MNPYQGLLDMNDPIDVQLQEGYSSLVCLSGISILYRIEW